MTNPHGHFEDPIDAALSDSVAFAAAVYGVERATQLLTGGDYEGEFSFILALFAVSGFLTSGGCEISENAIQQLAEIRAHYEAVCETGVLPQ